MLVDSSNIVLLTLKIARSDDVVLARQRARQIAMLLNFNLQNQTKIATVVSEIARNAWQYAEGGKIEYCLNKYIGGPAFVVKISDEGPGISNIDEILAEKSVSATGGIIGAKRLMDRFIIHSLPDKGTEVIAAMELPKSAPLITTDFLANITEELAKNRPNSASDEVLQQNQELLQALALLHKAKDELEEKVEERTIQLATANNELKQEILERKRMEKWMQQHQKDLAHVERINSMGEMVSALAHELNQPLAAITAYTQGCIRRLEISPYKIDEIIKVMKLAAKQSERAGEIIHRMKDFIHKGKLSIALADINHLIQETVVFMQHELEKQQVQIELKLENPLPKTMVDIIQLQQALTNLMYNAIQAMSASNTFSPTITINTILTKASYIEIHILDNGPGFTMDNPQILLQPYFTTKKSGMGMGLPISRTIIEAHGGNLTARNNLNEGACLQINLPVKGKASN